MTPEELRALALVMRELGVFKVTLADHVSIELSQHAIVAGQEERIAASAALEEAERPVTQPAPPPVEDEDDPLAYAATEGYPG